MIILDATTKSLEAKLGEAHTTNASPIVCCYVDVTTTTYVPSVTTINSNGTAVVTIAAAPAASTQRQIKFISLYNADTVSHVVTIQYNNNSTTYVIVKVTLAVGYTLIYTDGEGWRVIDTAGNLIQSANSSLHAPTHKSGGSDPIKLDELAAPTDVTTLNSSTSAHGLLKKLDNSAVHFMDGQGNWNTPSGTGLTAASAADQETATSTAVGVTPAVQQRHPSSPKFWCILDGTGTISITASYNTTSITDNGTGDYTVTIATDFSSAAWCPTTAVGQAAGNTQMTLTIVALAAGTIHIQTTNNGPAFADPPQVCVAGFGDQ